MLVVPPDLVERELGESFPDRESLEVRSADTVETALQRVAEWKPDLVVFRSQLGGESIARFCQRLKGATPAPRLLMLTDQLDETLGDADDATCDAHLVSPVTHAQLLDTMAELAGIDQRRSPRVSLDVLVHMDGFAGDGDGVGSFLANGVDLSVDGMRIEANCQLTVGSSGALQFFLPGEGDRLTLEGRVRLAIDEVRLLYVVEFLDLAPQHRSRIRQYVEHEASAA
jgi:CheY-like chemotaxis protein